MERATEIFAAIGLLVIGLSHMLQSQAWVEFFIWVRGKGRVGVFVLAFLSLNLGAFIVAFHNVWRGLPIVLTVFGWLQVFKGTLYFIAPGLGVRSLARVSSERAWIYVVGGVVSLVISAVLWYGIVFTSR
jgi:hypothetical protein